MYPDWNLENLLYLVYSKCLTAFTRVLIHIQIGWTHVMKNIHSKVILIQWPCINSTTHTKCLNVRCMLLFLFDCLTITESVSTLFECGVYHWSRCKYLKWPMKLPQLLIHDKKKTYSSQWAKNKFSLLSLMIWGNKMHQHKHPDRNTNLLWYGLTELMWSTKNKDSR